MRRQSETLLLVPLLPIFFVGMFPILLFGLLGFFGLGIFGVLLVSVGLTSALEAHGQFTEDIITHGYGRSAERAAHATDLQTATRFAALLDAAGIALIVASAVGFMYFG
ncbi:MULTISPECIES: hypothetical protein [Bradyrhizobium]|jgi:hypothetical protein|uniref:hypothetical protein n=1 Tax=Bradyrhizobium TaxID=374 RepID=UPI0010298E58|nr:MULTISPECIES: hypothetical protein [Bradyrhizobium]MBO4222129.1 hypothetical protein [Bradyrhizobium neotropicale]RZN32889.1 hypothetical protein CWO90_11990 [Bradyrhizobium sp. Leo121]